MTTALVTGCSTGIGFATSIRLARDGLDVVATMRQPDRDAAGLLAAAAEVGVSLRVVPLNVDDQESVDEAFAAAGPVDVLVNNAGIFALQTVEETSIEDWKQTFETNYFGAIRCIQAALPHMRAQRSGCIVNVSSAGGRVCLPASAAYASTKAALEATSLTLAMEARPYGIRVVMIDTGGVRTAIMGKLKVPSKASPYAATTKNTFLFMNSMMADLSDPMVIADAIAQGVQDPQPSFHIRAGDGSEEMLELRKRFDDSSWIDLLGSPTSVFADRYQQETGKTI